MEKDEPGWEHLRIYEKHTLNLQINSFHEITLIFKVTLNKQTVQENANQKVNGLLQSILK